MELRSCDPGKDATAVQPPKPSAFKVLATRSQIVAGALDDGASYALARCAAETIVAQLGPASMAALFDATDVNDPLVKRLSAAARKAGAVCVRSGFK